MSTLFEIFHNIQQKIFPWLEGELDPLTEKEQQFIQVVSLMDLGKHIKEYRWRGVGRRRKERDSIAKAFVAKAIYNFETTEILVEYLNGCKNLRRLCGWDTKQQIPSLATFSRAFSEFSQGQLPIKIHAAMVKEQCGTKVAGHVSRDATAIEVREKPAKKNKETTSGQAKAKRGRPCKGAARDPKEPKRLEIQPQRSLSENLKDLPDQCDVGTKKSSKGYKITWVGYKMHLDCIDGDIPVSAIITSASVHDSQVAIPLAQMTSERITNLYDLMDAAYDAPHIKSYSAHLGHVAIIDNNPRGGEKILMDPATKARFAERSSAERVNSNLKDNYGGRHIRVKGSQKVMTHLMFGIIALTATQLFRMLL
jgi:hypothetical protein